MKADSEGRPGPFAYGRNHADGANMLAEAVQPYGGTIIWRWLCIQLPAGLERREDRQSKSGI